MKQTTQTEEDLILNVATHPHLDPRCWGMIANAKYIGHALEEALVIMFPAEMKACKRIALDNDRLFWNVASQFVKNGLFHNSVPPTIPPVNSQHLRGAKVLQLSGSTGLHDIQCWGILGGMKTPSFTIQRPWMITCLCLIRPEFRAIAGRSIRRYSSENEPFTGALLFVHCPTMHLHAPIPILRIYDEAKAKEHYIGFLGFILDFEARFGDNCPLFMQLSRDGCILQFSEHYGDGVPGASVHVQVTGLEEFVRSLVEKDYKYSKPGIEETSWGHRETAIKDPFGNRIVFFEPMAAR